MVIAMKYTTINEDFSKLASEAKHARKKLKELSQTEHKYKNSIIVFRTPGYTTKYIGHILKVDFESGYFDVQRIDYNERVRVPIDKTSSYQILDNKELLDILPDIKTGGIR